MYALKESIKYAEGSLSRCLYFQQTVGLVDEFNGYFKVVILFLLILFPNIESGHNCIKHRLKG